MLIAIIMVIGATIAIVFRRLPLELIVFAQSVTILIVPFIGVTIYLIAGDGKLMGELKNKTTTKWIAGMGLLVVISLAVINMRDLFFKH